MPLAVQHGIEQDAVDLRSVVLLLCAECSGAQDAQDQQNCKY